MAYTQPTREALEAQVAFRLTAHAEALGQNQRAEARARALRSDAAASESDAPVEARTDELPADPIEREREVQIATIASQKDNLLKSASNAMRIRFMRVS